ncbi:MAG: glutamyl-tRNA reductase, partial [Gammaproteobacteria bacterium]|nr:glutamyl-tRNA reductase [Gammaproteobacteria bacterium]
EVLDKARRMLQQGKSPEEALQFLAHTLTNKLTHAPTTRINAAAREGRLDLVELARELLGLDNNS